MPLYEYKCEGCGDVFELIQKFVDAPLTTHDKCGGAVHRLVSAPSLRFKGSGWYITDYGSGKSDSNGKAESGGKPDGNGKSEGSKSEPAKIRNENGKEIGKQSQHYTQYLNVQNGVNY